MTGLDAREVPLMTRRLCPFSSTEALGIDPKDIGGCQAGRPGNSRIWYGFCDADAFWTQSRSIFLDLVRIAGLAHGTDVWLGNAQTLIQKRKKPLFRQQSVPR